VSNVRLVDAAELAERCASEVALHAEIEVAGSGRPVLAKPEEK
jgi:hypothetical protein